MPKQFTSWDDVPINVDLAMAARILGRRSPEYLKKLCQRGKFPGFKDGKFWLVSKADLMDYCRRQDPNRRNDRPIKEV